VRREAFLAVGGFDINLRRFCEDAEFCHRMKLAGHQLIKSHALIAIHHHAPAGGTYSQASAVDRAWTLMDQSFYFHRRIGGSPSELPRVAFDLMRSEYRRTRERGALSILTMALLMLASVAPACLSSFRKPRLLASAEARP
jgi:GT2 family glycosyltransferase